MLGQGWNFHKMSRTHAKSNITSKLLLRIAHEKLEHEIEEMHHQQEELERKYHER